MYRICFAFLIISYETVVGNVDISTKLCILKCTSKQTVEAPRESGKARRRIDSLRYSFEWDRWAEDSLENTFSCVPKVQG